MSRQNCHSRRATDLSVSAKRPSRHAPARSYQTHPVASTSNTSGSTRASSSARRLLLSPALLALALLLAPITLALDNNTIRPRTVYQVITDRFARTDNSYNATCGARNYCGGTWRGLISHLDYIQGMGFDTVWISPIVDNIDGYTHWGEAYHGYWTRDPTKLNSHFGGKDDLLALSSALHSRGMYLMVDIVVNHVATTQPGASFNPGTSYGPFTSQDDFHQPFCYIDYSSQTSIETCSLGDSYVPLPDINTEKASVVTFWNDWIRSTVQTYAIDAIRIDTVKHIRQSFWPGFTSSAGVFNFGEVFDGNPSYVAAYQNNGVNPLNYPVWYPLVRAFQQVGGNLNDLVWNVGQVQGTFKDVGLLGGFVNNHDNPRFEGLTQDPAVRPSFLPCYVELRSLTPQLRKNIHAFPFVSDGVPIVYYGSEWVDAISPLLACFFSLAHPVDARV